MKNVFKFLTLGTMLVAFYAVATTSTFAQATLEECTPIYERFKVERVSTDLDVLKSAIATGKDYLSKCSNLEGQEAVRDYITAQIPKIEDKIKQLQIKKMEARFNASLKANNADEIIASAKDLIGINQPYSLDLMLDIASVGFDKAFATPPVDKHINDSITYSKMALQKMSEGKMSGNADKYGFYAEYKTKDCADGKTNATGWMNYVIGYIMYARQKQMKEALPYLYKATQVGCETKDKIAYIYRTIGAWYIEEFKLLETKRDAKYKELQDLEKIKDPKLAEAEKEYDSIIALQKGYMERIMDAYARAYKIANADQKEKAEFKTSLLNRTKEFYGFRFNKDLTRFDAWLAGLTSKPFPDPTTPVTPIVETTTATTPSTAAMPTNTASTTTVAETRPRTATTTTTTGATTDIATAPIPNTAKKTTTKKAPAKKPAKKKGTR